MNRLNKIMGIGSNRKLSFGKSLSTAEEIYDGAVVKQYRIVEVNDDKHQFIGYTIDMGCKDIDDPDWKEKGFIPCNMHLVTKDLESLEDMLAGIVPDSTYPKLTVIQFHWITKQ